MRFRVPACGFSIAEVERVGSKVDAYQNEKGKMIDRTSENYDLKNRTKSFAIRIIQLRSAMKPVSGLSLVQNSGLSVLRNVPYPCGRVASLPPFLS
jgi:hypothetical protein